MTEPGAVRAARARPRRAHLAAVALLFVGLSQILGYAFRSPTLEIVGRMTAASPVPLVFDQREGLEYWALRYELHVVTNEAAFDLRSAPELFSRIRGPHIVRMAYLFPLVFAPVLPEGVRDSAVQHAWCRRGKLARDFAVPHDVSQIRVAVFHAKGRGTWRFTVECPR